MAHPKPTPLRIFAFTTLLLLFLGTVTLTVLLATDTIGPVPLLTPIAHILLTIITPFIPLLAPLTLGAFIKLARHEPFPKKKCWVLIYGFWFLQHLQRVFKGGKAVWMGNAKLGQMVEIGGLCMVVLGEGLDVKWEAGWIDRWVECVAAGGHRQAELKKIEAAERLMEEGGAAAGEKVVVIVQEAEFVNAEEEKKALMAKEEVLVDVEETKA